ncbi:hypothetical protein PCASD_00229 [Puccinia coronata f. sp. avenae]|uniref:Uncharacterized protein n=1 Tax=Puccinia coronata f. sp. avenae TaxID=200324 RepID=A0A2N5VQK5_9BASI|nr:hypothetical protein PCASD_00229 [Puccinia coronata f. sp. avenae]
MLYGVPIGDNTPEAASLSQFARINQLTAGMAQVQKSMARMMKFLEESTFTPCPNPSHENADANTQQQHAPHNQSHPQALDPTFHGPTGLKFAHIARLEPPRFRTFGLPAIQATAALKF